MNTTGLAASAEARRERARVALDGLSIGDAFGQRFFEEEYRDALLGGERRMPSAPWDYTDDSEMAFSLVATLRRAGTVDQDALAASFARRYTPTSGYGPAMHRLLPAIANGADWRVEAPNLFHGQGSYGNGSAMRVAPLGAYFADDLTRVAAQARASAEVTHAHPEGIAGAVAVASAAALACAVRGEHLIPSPAEFIERVATNTPESRVRRNILQARDVPAEWPIRQVARALGNGSWVSAQDTVPFCVWSAATSLASYEEAQWRTVSALGDIDTTCAIVGGIVACAVGEDGIPAVWRAAREPLPAWIFNEEIDEAREG